MLAIVYSCGRRPLDYHLRELRVSLYSFYYAQACSESPLTVAVVHDFVSLRGSVCNRALLLRVPAGDPLSRTRHTNDGPNEALAGAYSFGAAAAVARKAAALYSIILLYMFMSNPTEWSRKRQYVVDCQGRRHSGPVRYV